MPLFSFFSLHSAEEDTGKLKASQMHTSMNRDRLPVECEPLGISTKKSFKDVNLKYFRQTILLR